MSRTTKVVHLTLAPDVHARFRERAEAAGEPLARVVTLAAIAGLDGPPAATANPPAPPAPTVAMSETVIGDYGSVRVPLALFDAALHAGMTVPFFLEEVIGLGMRDFITRQNANAQ